MWPICDEYATVPIIDFTMEQAKAITNTFIQRRRPPEEVRDQVDRSFRVEQQSIVIYEIRARWNQPSEKQEINIAKATYVPSRKIWEIQWQRADLRWHSYEPLPEVGSIAEFIEELEEDPHCSFWG